ncbi:MAG: DUF1638 domain-containing protein [Candidatus Omnitrophica bacterium]|nr:DUF1638 domain-containing protein [Candidatus Omnitrophota bacterium]
MKTYTIVSCGTMRLELEQLRKEGFLHAQKILYTAPGLHENRHQLEKQLKTQLDSAKKYAEKIIVIYGDRCYINTAEPSLDIDGLIQRQGGNIVRIKAKNCIDMLCSIDQREKIAAGQKVYWLSPGWLKYWKVIFKDWDVGKANETFPQHDKAIVLDGLGFFEQYSADDPEKILEFADWMKLNVEPHTISLERLKKSFSEVL